MGLMTDDLHNEIKTMRVLMLQVAKGQTSIEYMGKWLYTYHREHCGRDLPANMQHELRIPDKRTRDSIGPGFRNPHSGAIY